jgi:hypothetical protein
MYIHLTILAEPNVHFDFVYKKDINDTAQITISSREEKINVDGQVSFRNDQIIL